MVDVLDNGVRVLLHTEVRLVGYGESDSSGPWIKLALPDPELLAEIRPLKGGVGGKACPVLHLTLAEGDIASAPLPMSGGEGEIVAPEASQAVDPKPTKPKKGPYGQFAQMLVTAGFHHNPHVLAALAPDAQYQDWCRSQPCVICRPGVHGDWDEKKGEIRNQFAHVRRAANSGTGYKAEFQGCPMCGKHHGLQHQQGELAAYRLYRNMRAMPDDRVYAPADAKAFFDGEVIKHVERWAWQAIRAQFGVESMTMIHPHDFLEWAEEQGLSKYITKKYREAAARVENRKQDHD